MRDFKIQTYQKKLEYSFCVGVFPTIELLEKKPEQVSKVLLHSRGKLNDGVKKIQDICRKKNIKMEISDGLISKISSSENAYAIAVFEKYSTELEKGANHVVLVNPEDTGNLGTIMRTMLGFGVKNLAIIRPGVDSFDPKTIRASMGAIFHLNVEYFEDMDSYQKAHNNNCYMFMINGNYELSKVTFEKPFALVFGSESGGLSNEFVDYGRTVSIKQTKAVDSLNLSIAVGVALYSAFR